LDFLTALNFVFTEPVAIRRPLWLESGAVALVTELDGVRTLCLRYGEQRPVPWHVVDGDFFSNDWEIVA
jgi:hypothetical protein